MSLSLRFAVCGLLAFCGLLWLWGLLALCDLLALRGLLAFASRFALLYERSFAHCVYVAACFSWLLEPFKCFLRLLCVEW